MDRLIQIISQYDTMRVDSKMIISILSLVSSWVTSIATSFTAYRDNSSEKCKSDNYLQKLKTVLNVCVDTYRNEIVILQEVFRIENYDKELYEISKIEDLEMIAYIENIIKSSQRVIDEFPNKTNKLLCEEDYERLYRFYSLLNNFFRTINDIKDEHKKSSHITIRNYKEKVMTNIPYSVRKQCGGLNVDFSHFLENFDKHIEGMWTDIQKNLFEL